LPAPRVIALRNRNRQETAINQREDPGPSPAAPRLSLAPQLRDDADRASSSTEELEEARARIEELSASLDAASEESGRYRDLFALAPHSYLVTDPEGTILEANQATLRLLRTDLDRLHGEQVTIFLKDIGSETLASKLDRLRLGQEVGGWQTYVQPNGGGPFPATVSATAAVDLQGQVVGLRWQLHDISDHKLAEERIAFRANHDRLTGLPNGAMFEERLGFALARARREGTAVAVLYIDLDNFKAVNDTRGHSTGDELLRQVATRLHETSRDTDLVARLGGDEFAILLSDLAAEEAAAGEEPRSVLGMAEWVAKRVQEALRTPFEVAESRIYATGSIGISVFPLDAENEQAILRNADGAMYRSKKLGPGGYATHVGHVSQDEMAIRALELQAAVESEQWVLHYQPMVDLARGFILGTEALLRWQKPDGTLVQPQQFIHLAEDLGLIEQIGDWVLREVSRQSHAWHQQGMDIDISLNLSAHQLWDTGFAKRVIDTLTAAHVDPTSVVLEITESVAMTDPDRRLEILWDLHNHGVRLAIDDFGTGYSSLSRLRHLPVDMLKIDQSFVQSLSDGRDGNNLGSAVIQLAHILGMTPLAEGIETREQQHYLITHGCTQGQGYLFSRPLTAEQMAAQYRERIDTGVLWGPGNPVPAGYGTRQEDDVSDDADRSSPQV
jgi:diguanylate cyclase (GGDEF)-like protein/PAS domain S-box-containing protein